MAERLTFDDQVVVITGAGNGLGRAYAHEFARRGARVVVNDLGGSVDGRGSDQSAADAVVDEITSAGGTAIANHDSVVNGERIVEIALDTWGRIDVLINNAGIAYPTPFAQMDHAAWTRMFDVHVEGARACTHAAWSHMMEQGYGRLLFTTSPFGLHSAAAFAHYSAAKAALIGLTRALTLEGAAHDIHANAVAPYSASRMTGRTNEEQASSPIGPRYLAQLIAWLCHRTCEENGSVFEAGGGYIHKVRWQLSRGLALFGDEHNAENIAAGLGQLNDFTDAIYPGPGEAHTVGLEVSGGDLSKLREGST